jgi:hypothetical protein
MLTPNARGPSLRAHTPGMPNAAATAAAAPAPAHNSHHRTALRQAACSGREAKARGGKGGSGLAAKPAAEPPTTEASAKRVPAPAATAADGKARERVAKRAKMANGSAAAGVAVAPAPGTAQVPADGRLPVTLLSGFLGECASWEGCLPIWSGPAWRPGLACGSPASPRQTPDPCHAPGAWSLARLAPRLAGAGKTTLLKRILLNAQGMRVSNEHRWHLVATLDVRGVARAPPRSAAHCCNKSALTAACSPCNPNAKPNT